MNISVQLGTALTMALLLGFEFKECEWRIANGPHFCFSCIYTHCGCCGKVDREAAVWAFLVFKGVTTGLPTELTP